MSYTATIEVDDSCQYRSGGYWRTNVLPVPIKIIRNSMAPDYIPNYRETAQKENEKFKKEVVSLIEQWTNEVENISSFSDMVSHRDYITISAKGRRAIPILLNELRHRPHFWFDALQILIKANLGIDVDPVNVEDRGDLLKMASAWIAWGEENEYI